MLCLCVCQYLWDRPLQWRPGCSFIFSICYSSQSSLSGRPPLSVCSAYLEATTSVVSAVSLWQLQNQSLLVLIQSQRDLGSFFCSVCSLSEALFRHSETIRSINSDLWCLILPPCMGPVWKRGTPCSGILWEKVCEDARKVTANWYELYYEGSEGVRGENIHFFYKETGQTNAKTKWGKNYLLYESLVVIVGWFGIIYCHDFID